MSVFKNHNYYPEPFKTSVWGKPAHSPSRHQGHDVLKREVFYTNGPIPQVVCPYQKAAILAFRTKKATINSSGFKVEKFLKFSKDNIIFYMNESAEIKRTRTVLVRIYENSFPKIGPYYYTGYYNRTSKYEIIKDDGSIVNCSVEELVGMRW